MSSLSDTLSELNSLNESVNFKDIKKQTHSKSMKSRATVFDSITDALRKGYVGQVFSTKESDRLYVITVQKWGTDPEQIINGRSAKAFYKYSDAKKFAVRTMIRHAGERSKDLRKKVFGKEGSA
jgi:hypothetical protein